MDSKIFPAVAFLGLLVTCCQPTPLPEESFEGDKQIGALGVGSFALGLATPTLANLLAIGAVNGVSALYNLLVSTFAGRRLEMISPESLFATPIEDSSASNIHSSTPGGEPPRRRPYTRSRTFDEDKPLQESQPKARSSS